MHLGDLVMIISMIKVEECCWRVWRAECDLSNLLLLQSLNEYQVKLGVSSVGVDYLVESKGKSESWYEQRRMWLQENERRHDKETIVKNTQWHLALRDIQFEGVCCCCNAAIQQNEPTNENGNYWIVK